MRILSLIPNRTEVKLTLEDDVRSYLVDMAEQLAQLAQKEGVPQAAGYFALAGMALRVSSGDVAQEHADPGQVARAELQQADRRAQS